MFSRGFTFVCYVHLIINTLISMQKAFQEYITYLIECDPSKYVISKLPEHLFQLFFRIYRKLTRRAEK